MSFEISVSCHAPSQLPSAVAPSKSRSDSLSHPATMLAFGMAIGSMFILGPILRGVMTGLGNGVEWLVDHHMLPFTAVIIEPAKVLFLNNAINHGVLTPLGLDQAKQAGHSALFLLEANPGPGAGLLLAFMLFGRGVAKATAPGALIIQFFGGIHEVYFPYVLAKPRLVQPSSSSSVASTRSTSPSC